jgi:hypothetical protein
MEIIMQKAEQASEPPSCLLPPIFMIGRDSRGNWVAQERSGGRGGLFINCAEALQYAKFESGNYPRAVVMVSGPLELDASCADARSLRQRHAEVARHHRRVA